MPWTHVLADWPRIAHRLCRDFRHLEEAALRRFRGDRDKLVIYLADTHDLTLAEAAETLEDWLLRVARPLAAAA
ncbi:MAG: hypothetical protein HLUCCA08_17860 [Rhodobacteraceae bacterium HLUCCA08]|nr:MAG: hypothetical protein HLUCCA08_17860 [Rhodobacteraceae bacterium HLUCCA08]